MGLGSQAWLWSPLHGRQAADGASPLPRDIGETPYWTSWARVRGAVASSTVFYAVNLVYLIRVYGPGGVLVDSIDVAPESWRQAHRPRVGEFVIGDGPGQDRAKMCAYLRDATFITGLAAVSDTVLVVTHGYGRHLANWRQSGGDTRNSYCDEPWSLAGLTNRSEYANVFVRGVNVVRDAPAPGEILGYANGRIVVVRPVGDAQDDSIYTLVEYSVVSPY